MNDRYPALKMVASLLKTISVVFVLVSLGLSFWYLFEGQQDNIKTSAAIAGILVSLVGGIVIYALSDLFRCFMDIESNTRAKLTKLNIEK